MDYGYARVSTQDQDLTIQLAALEQAGIHPSRIVEEKRSGVAKALPVRDQILAQLQPGDRLTVWKLDRLGRSLVELLAIVQDLEARRVAFRCTTQPIDTSTPAGRAFLQLLAVFAEFERQMILERTAAGKARRKAEGKHPGGPRMYGFTAKTLEPIEDEQDLIREAAERVLQGEPMNQVVDDWHERGLRPIRGQRWKVVSLRRLLLNPRTAEVVDQDTYNKLVRMFSQPDRQRLGRPAEHLLSGILSCQNCSQPLYGAHKGGKDHPPQLVYRCRKGSDSGGRFAGCGSTVVSMRRADAWARDAFVAAVAGPDFARAMAQRQKEILSLDSIEGLDAMREEAAELEQVQGTRYYSEAMRDRHAELRRMVDQATARLMMAPEVEEMMNLPQTREALEAAWAGWDTANRRRWLKRIFSTIVVQPATVRGRGSDVGSRMAPVWIV